MELSCYIVIVLSLSLLCSASACSNGECQLGDACSSNADCGTGLYCFKCEPELSGPKCVRYNISDPFTVVNNTMPFNKYAYLTTHNAFAIDSEPSQTGVPRVTTDSQEDTVTKQLNNGVRALMLDTYDFRGDVWLCHSSGGKCYDTTAYELHSPKCKLTYFPARSDRWIRDPSLPSWTFGPFFIILEFLWSFMYLWCIFGF